MKLIIFVVVVIIVYLLMIKFFANVNQPHPEPKKIPPPTQPLAETSNQLIHQFPRKNELIHLIKKNYLNPKYYFNLPNKPSNTRYPLFQQLPQDIKYLKYIKEDINQWNKILEQQNIFVYNIKPIVIVETENEFLIKINVKLSYCDKFLYLQLSYYGVMDKTDDFFDNNGNTISLQMIGIDEITKQEYHRKPLVPEATFMTMEEQMAYVDKINKMHENEEFI